MKVMKLLVGLGAAGAVLAVLMTGGEARQKKENPFGQETPERVLILAIDDTGSMDDCLGPAWELMERALDQEFRLAAGTSKVVVAVLSRRDPIALVGTPMQMRQAHPDFDSFKQWLRKAPQVGSRIHDGVADAVEFSKSLPGNPVPTLLVFSDMEDSTGTGRDRLLKSLAEFGKRPEAAAGFYFVRQDAPFWAAAVKARVKYSVVSTMKDLSPQLPVRD